MNFINNHDFIVAGAAVAGFLLGAGVMWIYRHFKEPYDLKEYRAHTIEAIKRKIADAETIKLRDSEIGSLTYELQQLQNLPDVAHKLEQLAKIEAEIEERQAENFRLRKENGRLKDDNLATTQKQEQEKAKQERARQRQENQVQTQEANDAISDLEEGNNKMSYFQTTR